MDAEPTSGFAADVAAVEEARAASDIRERRHAVSKADGISAVLLGGGFLVVVIIGLVRCLDAGAADLGLLALLAGAHVLGGRVMFESTAGTAVATQPVLVVAWLVLPPMLVPVVVAVGLLTGQRLAWSTESAHRVLVNAASGWHSLGGVIVLSIADVEPALSHWPWYALALATQFALDAAVAAIRCRSLGLRLDVLVKPLTWMYGIDALLAPIGLTAVLSAGATGWAVLLAMSPIGVLWLVSRDRVETFERAATIGGAFEDVMNVARTDPLTGLPNRRSWDEAVANAGAVFAHEPATPITVIMGDVDGLKAINDTLGHEAGDRMIVEAAGVLRRAMPPEVLVARLGGDEFGVLALDVGCSAEALIDATRLELRSAPDVDGRRVSISLGAATCDEAGDLEGARALADERSLAAKAARGAGRANDRQRSPGAGAAGEAGTAGAVGTADAPDASDAPTSPS